LDVVTSVRFHAELPFEITGTNKPKWLEKPLHTALVLFTGMNGS